MITRSPTPTASCSTTPVDADTRALDTVIANVDVLAAPPEADTGQAALAVRVISQLGASGGAQTVSGTVAVSNLPAVQPVSDNGGSITVDGPLTDGQLRANPVPVSGTFYPATQPVSGTVAVSNFPATQPVSIAAAVPVTDNAGSLTVDGSVSVSNFPATQPVSGTVAVSNFPASQAVTGPLTDAQIRATPLPVSGTFYQATQPVSGTVAVSNFPASQAVTGTFYPATQPVSATQLPAALAANGGMKVEGVAGGVAVPVSGTVAVSNSFALDATLTGGTQKAIVRAAAKGSTAAADVTSAATDANTQALHTHVVNFPATQPVSGAVSLGTNAGKTQTMKSGSLSTSTINANQVILTYTVTAGTTFYMTYLYLTVRLGVFATTATNFGNASLESPGGTPLLTWMNGGPGITNAPAFLFPEPLFFSAGSVVRVVVTPSATTSFIWIACFGGYEK